MRIPLELAASTVVEEAKETVCIQGPSASPGDEWPAYFNPNLRQYVEASVPTAPPHRQTGTLQSSIHSVRDGRISINVVADPKDDITGKPYAAALELGEGKKGPRPFMNPSLLRSIDKIHRAFYKFLGA